MTLIPTLFPDLTYPITVRHQNHHDLVMGEDSMGFLALRCEGKRHSDEMAVGGGGPGKVADRDRWVHPTSIRGGRVYDF